MYEKILEIIEKYAGFPQSQLLRDKLAKEIADMNREFNLWLTFADHCFYPEKNNKWFCDIQSCMIETTQEYWNYDQIFNYWLDNIREK